MTPPHTCSGQRFFFNTKHWGGDSYPIFLMIGGEGPESKASVTDRWYFYQLAEQHQALLVCLEHRFYGKSFPTPVRPACFIYTFNLTRVSIAHTTFIIIPSTART